MFLLRMAKRLQRGPGPYLDPADAAAIKFPWGLAKLVAVLPRPPSSAYTVRWYLGKVA
jgi:hypothetical protein